MKPRLGLSEIPLPQPCRVLDPGMCRLLTVWKEEFCRAQSRRCSIHPSAALPVDETQRNGKINWAASDNHLLNVTAPRVTRTDRCMNKNDVCEHPPCSTDCMGCSWDWAKRFNSSTRGSRMPGEASFANSQPPGFSVAED